jgi:hypothetical protein
LTIDVAGHRFTPKPDKGTTFSAEKATISPTRSDIVVGSPNQGYFPRKVRLIREKVLGASSRSASHPTEDRPSDGLTARQ